MPYRNIEPVSKQLTIVVGLTVVGFMAFGLALSYYRNVLFDQRLETIRGQNDLLKQDMVLGYRSLEYYRSSQYKDKYAKENLGLLNPGEKVLILKKQAAPLLAEDLEATAATAQREAAFFEHLRMIPVFEHWSLYLFHRAEVEELKKGL